MPASVNERMRAPVHVDAVCVHACMHATPMSACPCMHATPMSACPCMHATPMSACPCMEVDAPPRDGPAWERESFLHLMAAFLHLMARYSQLMVYAVHVVHTYKKHPLKNAAASSWLASGCMGTHLPKCASPLPAWLPAAWSRPLMKKCARPLPAWIPDGVQGGGCPARSQLVFDADHQQARY
eukprot:353484-Chlamydomonas_euryale.AAC.2